MDKLLLEIVALSHSITLAQSYAVVLAEVDGQRRLPIVIGSFEAQAIAVATEKFKPTRPLTHDLVKNIFTEFNIILKEVIINNLLDGIFYAKLVCDLDGEEMEIDSRTSDALALAARFDCPIYTYEFIMDTAGILLDEMEQKGEGDLPKKKTADKKAGEPVESGGTDLSKQSLEKLNALLADAIKKEDYEKAAGIRDEINKRS